MRQPFHPISAQITPSEPKTEYIAASSADISLRARATTPTYPIFRDTGRVRAGYAERQSVSRRTTSLRRLSRTTETFTSIPSDARSAITLHTNRRSPIRLTRSIPQVIFCPNPYQVFQARLELTTKQAMQASQNPPAEVWSLPS